ncbi:MAG: HAD family hydrolase [Bacillaceae bacterium]|nr:HAD family hydrolase [Bacillaceae bacterium]
MVKAVLFDFDLTLCDRDASVINFVESQYDRFHTYLSHIPKDIYVQRFIELGRRGYIWKDKVYKELCSEFNIKELAWETLLDDYMTEFHKSCMPYPNLIDLLDQLKQNNLLLGLITNAHGDFQFKNIQTLGIDTYFSVILISEWEGIKKPDPEIFRRALKQLGVQAKETVYVGDHPVNDVVAAQNAGLKGIWKKDLQWDPPKEADGIIDDLLELPDLIKKLNSPT